ncbi:MAG: PEP-CTERM sorting domain-containing protein [Burkholderiales bacterium]
MQAFAVDPCVPNAIATSDASVNCVLVTGNTGSEELDVDGVGGVSWTKVLFLGGDSGSATSGVPFEGLTWTLVTPTATGGTGGDFKISISDDATPGTTFDYQLLVTIGTTVGGPQHFSNILRNASDPTQLLTLSAGSTIEGTWNMDMIGASTVGQRMEFFTVFINAAQRSPNNPGVPEPGALLLLAAATFGAGIAVRRRSRG